MNADQWEQIKRIFDSALSLSVPARAAYLDEACAGAPEIRQTVEDLIRSNDNAGSFMESGIVAPSLAPVFTKGDLVAGRFRIVRFIDRGGMGEVYEAFDERLRVRLAIKTILAEHATSPDALERFQREVRVAREVAHENLCRVFELVEHVPEPGGAGAENGVISCLTMQLLDGETLQKRLERAGPLPVQQAISIARQIAAALDALHDAGIVHRDLKPGNVVLVPSVEGADRVLVTDFGLAKPVNPNAGWFESRADLQAGAPYFVAPELLRSQRPTASSDIYALGLVIDEMVTHSRAFPANSIGDLYSLKLSTDPVEPSQRARNLPASWNKVILRCLERDPTRRYARASHVVQALAASADEAPLASAAAVGAPNQGAALTGNRRESDNTALLPANSVAVALPAAPATKPAPERFHFWSRSSTVAALAILLVIAAIVGAASYRTSTSLIVFPINDLTDQPEGRRFATGTRVELVRRLVQVRGLRAIRNDEPRKTDTKFDADYALEGTLQRDGSHLRLNMQVTKLKTGETVWSENFDTERSGSMEIQTQLAARTVEALERDLTFHYGSEPIRSAGLAILGPVRRLLQVQIGPPPAPPTTNSLAQQHYLAGLSHWAERTPEATRIAIGEYEKAIAEDPRFALAWSAIADAQFTLIEMNDPDQARRLAIAETAAANAVTFEPGLPEAHLSVAMVRQARREWQGAEAAFKRAIELRPRFARARRYYAGWILQFGRFDEALAEARIALEDDPYDYPAKSAYGVFLFYSGRNKEAVEQLEQLLRGKSLFGAHVTLAYVYAKMAQSANGPESARYLSASFEQMKWVEQDEKLRKGTDIGMAPPLNAFWNAVAGNHRVSLEIVQRLAEFTEQGKFAGTGLAMIYAALGDRNAALNALELAERQGDRGLMFAKVHPLLESLRGEPRFKELIKRIRL